MLSNHPVLNIANHLQYYTSSWVPRIILISKWILLISPSASPLWVLTPCLLPLRLPLMAISVVNVERTLLAQNTRGSAANKSSWLMPIITPTKHNLPWEWDNQSGIWLFKSTSGFLLIRSTPDLWFIYSTLTSDSFVINLFSWLYDAKRLRCTLFVFPILLVCKFPVRQFWVKNQVLQASDWHRQNRNRQNCQIYTHLE